MSEITPHVRESPAIRMRRANTPYANWFDGAYYTDTHAHPTPRDPLTAPPEISLKKTWSEEKRMGSRHVLDTAPFSLWHDDENDYKKPTKTQLAWVRQTYKATGGQFRAPFFIVATETPSLPGHGGHISLTLGCAPVIFTSPKTFEESNLNMGYPSPNALHLIDRDLSDPISQSNHITKWTQPSISQVKAVFEEVLKLCSPTAISFVAPCIVVEMDGNSAMKSNKFPGVIAGWPVSYHFGSYWGQPELKARLRELDPSDFNKYPKGDTTNYLRIRDGIVGPGIRIEGKTRASSSGIRIRRGTEVRVLLSNHAVADSEYVYHPDGESGDRIGDIIERYPDEDWALMKLYPSVIYSNHRVFETPTPKCLVNGGETQAAEWFVCDGMTTGKIAMRYGGSKWTTGISGPLSTVDLASLEPSSVYFGLSPTGGAPAIRDGICGAPIINERTGGVVGNFQYVGPNGWCFSPQLDFLMEEGWELY